MLFPYLSGLMVDIAQGNFTKIEPEGPKEVKDLAVSFNRMTEMVEKSQQSQRDFVLNVSHELKSPLTSIRGFAQAIADHTVEDEQMIQRALKIIDQESGKMQPGQMLGKCKD